VKSQSIFVLGNKVIIHEKTENKPEQNLPILVFTKTGKELLNLVNTVPELDYIQLLAAKIDRANGSIKYGEFKKKFPEGKIIPSNLIDVPLTNVEIEKLNKKKEAENKKRN
jgi:hypothetical protein